MPPRRRKSDISGWRSDMEFDQINSHVNVSLNAEGWSVYLSAYNEAKQKKEAEVPDDAIRKEVIGSPLIRPVLDGQNAWFIKAENELSKKLVEIKQKAVEDALAGRPPSQTQPTGPG